MTDKLTDEERESLAALNDFTCKGVAPLAFTEINDFTTFKAEYAFDGGDIILHFFPSPEREGDTHYWLQLFPAVLDPVAREVFDATAPRLTAAYTEEMDSWWLRARNYWHILDKEVLTLRFLEKLDQTLDTTIST